MLRIVSASLDDKHVVLVESEGTFYQMRFIWPWETEVERPSPGETMVYAYPATERATSEDIAFKWGNWDQALMYDDAEMPPPPELVEAVQKSWDDYKAGRGYTP